MSRSGHLGDEELLGPHTNEEHVHLGVCSSCSQRKSNQEWIRAAIRDLDRTAPAPPDAVALLAEAAAPSPLRRLWLTGTAVALAGIVAATVWAVRRPLAPLPAPVVDELALDHLHYEHKTDAAAVKGNEATIASYFTDKLGFSPHLGPLEAVTIEGAKPCRIAGHWTALVWLDRAGHWLSLFTMPQQIADGRGCSRAEGVLVCASPDPRGGARVLVGDLPQPEMMRLLKESL